MGRNFSGPFCFFEFHFRNKTANLVWFLSVAMELKKWGYTSELEEYRIARQLSGLEVGRVIAEHKERYQIRGEFGEVDAEVTGNIRFTARNREDFPAVGDWVAFMPYDSGFGIIHHVFPRYSMLTRPAVGKFGEIQIIAANIDFAFLIQAVDRDFNLNRLERYLALSRSANVEPVILLNKTDLITESDLAGIIGKIAARIPGVQALAISNETEAGLDQLRSIIQSGKTYCMLGSSGVGKSTLLNKLSGKEQMKVDVISNSTAKGRHTTSHRELILLENGGLLIDNPGMREIGIADSGDGVEQTFTSIIGYSKQCKYLDCTHTSEPGCGVLAALERGDIDAAAYENFMKMEREKAYFESSVAERRERDRKFGKFFKNYQKDLKRLTGE